MMATPRGFMCWVKQQALMEGLVVPFSDSHPYDPYVNKLVLEGTY